MQDRLATLENVRQAGISVCAGGIIGLGEGKLDRVGLLHQVGWGGVGGRDGGGCGWLVGGGPLSSVPFKGCHPWDGWYVRGCWCFWGEGEGGLGGNLGLLQVGDALGGS